ncbi:dephospho-CoA kinase [Phocaeicola vulgatus]|uniref:dephospho-CoA kinase n=1 Tax=Phocaeicola vulgatus TaxID=821 RepID=UPI003562544D
MIKIAVTGGIGSGKSYISHLLENMHIPVYNADNEAKRLTVSDAGIRGELIALLGEEVYKDGLLNKPLLASYLFSDPVHVLQINSIIHPQVRKDFTVWVERQEKCEIVGMESAILYEAGFQDTVDAVIMVYAPVELRIQRAMYRDGASEEQVRARIAAQMDDEEKRRRADFTVVNDGVQLLIPQLNRIVEQLKTEKFIL